MTDLNTLAEALRQSKHVAVLSGAGVSAESGIPTFRDALEGYWSKYDPEQLATPEAFARDPELVTRWYDERRQKVSACQPNAAHLALVELENWLIDAGKSFVILTQNVDGLHQRAGSKDVVEVHGSLLKWRCTKTNADAPNLPMPFPTYPMKSAGGGFLRPGVVWFGEHLPEDAVSRVESAIEKTDLFIAMGTSGLVYPAAGWSEAARRHGALTVELNRDPTPLSTSFDLVLRGSAGEILSSLVSEIRRG